MNSVRSILKSKIRALRALFGLAFILVLANGCITIPQLVTGNPSPMPASTAAIPLTAATQASTPTTVPATVTQASAPTAVPPTATEVPSPTAIPPTAAPSPTPPPTVVAIPVNPQSNPPTMSLPMTGSQQISIANFSFNPASLTILVDTQVTWTNHDNVAHTVTADNGAFNSGMINPGASFRFVFNQPGIFSYHCQIHPMMKGIITVTNKMAMPAMPAVPPASSVPTVVAIPVNSLSSNGVMTVTIQNFAFSPQTLTIAAGTKVQWINNDATAHTVTANSRTFDSNVLQPGSRFAVTFSQPGTYTYHCKIHPNMVGTIIVTGMRNMVPNVPPSGGGGASPSSPSYPSNPSSPSGGSYPMYP